MDRPKSVRFEVPGGDLSPSLRGMPGMVPALLYDEFVLKVDPPKPAPARPTR